MKKICGWGFAAILVILSVATVAQADAPHVRMIANDPAFDSLVNPDVLREAAEGKDAGIMVDAAIMLERAEQTLHRPHQGGTADDMFRYAWRTANVYNDGNAKERIKQHLEYYKRDDFLRELEGIQEVAPKIPPRPQYGGGSEQELYNDFMNQAEDALRRLDRSRAEELERQVSDPNCPLTDRDKNDVYTYLEKVTTQIYQATHNEDGTEKREVRPWGWGHGPATVAPPAPQPEEPAPVNSWGPRGPHFGAPIAPPPAEQAPYRSKALKALFKHAPHGAEIVTIFPGSPLAGRLQPGDIITTLDGVPVNSTWELENHYAATQVDYMDHRGLHQRTMIRIRPN